MKLPCINETLPSLKKATVIIDEIQINVDDPNQAYAVVYSHVEDSAGNVIETISRTDWGPTGSNLPYNHIADANFPSHTQPLPTFNTNYTTSSGTYLVLGESYDLKVTATLPDGTECESELRTITLPAGKATAIANSFMSVDASNSSQIRASHSFDIVRVSDNTPVSVVASTYFRVVGSATWQVHTSPGPFPSHVQLLPMSVPPYLLADTDYEFYTEWTDPDTGELCQNDTQTFATGAVTPGTFEFRATDEVPPTMDRNNMTCITEVSQMGESYYNPGSNAFHCKGNAYIINGPGDGHDLFLNATDWGTIRQPIIISNFRNVIVLGLDIEAFTNPGCDVGEALMFHSGNGANYPNSHPHIPWNRLLSFSIFGTSWVEGTHSRMLGHAGDHIVTNGASSQSAADKKARRKTKLVNSRFTGVEGNSDGLHGDLLQNQDLDSQAEMVLINVMSKSAYSHATTANGGDSPWGLNKIHNTSLVLDPDYGTDQAGTGLPQAIRPDEINSPTAVGRPTVWDVKDMRVQPEGGTFRVAVIISDTTRLYIYAPTYYDGTPTGHNSTTVPNLDRNEITEYPGGYQNNDYLDPVVQAAIDADDPAPAAYLGAAYVSPWKALYDTYCN